MTEQLRNEVLNDQTIVEIVFEIQNIVSQCSRLAEILFNNLKSLNKQFEISGKYENIFPIEIEKMGLDFMGHRDKFSDVIKQKIKQGELKDIDRKSITKPFCNFIKDRNKYTHGEVLYWYPNRKTIIEYEDEEKQKTYGELNKDVLNSFIDCYYKLNEFIKELKDDEKP